MDLNSDAAVKAELIDYLDDDMTLPPLADEIDGPYYGTNARNGFAQEDVSYMKLVDTAGGQSSNIYEKMASVDPSPATAKPQSAGLPVDAYPNYRNYIFWFLLDLDVLDKQILFRHAQCITYKRNKLVCSVLSLLISIHLLLFHGQMVNWLTKMLKLTLSNNFTLPAGILWLTSNILIIAVLICTGRYVWIKLQELWRIHRILPLVLPDNVLYELELKDPVFRRLFFSEESLRPSHFVDAPATAGNRTPVSFQPNNSFSYGIYGTLPATPPVNPNPGFFDGMLPSLQQPQRQSPNYSFNSSTQPQAGHFNWKMPEQPFSWFHLGSRQPPAQLPQIMPQLPRYMQDEYVERQRQQEAAAFSDSVYQAWHQQQQHQLSSNTFLHAGNYNAGRPYETGSSMLYPTSMLRNNRSNVMSPTILFAESDADASMMSTSSASSSASRRSRTPSCLLHEHDKFDSIDRESVFNTYGSPAVERAFQQLKQMSPSPHSSSNSPAAFYSSQALARLIAGGGGQYPYNTSGQFDVPQTLDMLLTPPPQSPLDTSFGFLRRRRRKSSSTSMDMGVAGVTFDSSQTLTPDEIWHRLGLSPGQVYTYTQNLKHWMLITIVRPLDALVDEADRLLTNNRDDTTASLPGTYQNLFANATSIRAHPDISALRQALRSKPNECRLLNNLIPFLEAFVDAATTSLPRSMPRVGTIEPSIKYALERVNILSNASGIMNSYTWDAAMSSGAVLTASSPFSAQQQPQFSTSFWGKTPSTPHAAAAPPVGVVGDAVIVFNAFRTFFDVIMSADPRSAQPFSYHYVLPVSGVDAMATSRSPFPMLFQESSASGMLLSSPSQLAPNFQVVYEGKFLQPERGRNNLFHAILLFLVLLRNRFEDGRGAVWLGYAGAHIFDIFRSDYREFMESHLISG